jgi:hypothetical protein
LNQAQGSTASATETFDYHEGENDETFHVHEGENEGTAAGIDRSGAPTEDPTGEISVSDENLLAVEADTPAPVGERSTENEVQVLPHDDNNELYGEEHERDPITTGASDDYPGETDQSAVVDINGLHSVHTLLGEVPSDGLEPSDEPDQYIYDGKLYR